jgi:hypothetical protein
MMSRAGFSQTGVGKGGRGGFGVVGPRRRRGGRAGEPGTGGWSANLQIDPLAGARGGGGQQPA